MPERLVWFRAVVSLPLPFLASALAMAIGKPWPRKTPLPTYIDMVRHNIKALASALKQRPFAPRRP